MKQYLDNIRMPVYGVSAKKRLLFTIFAAALGAALGTFSKFLDCTASNHLPYIMSALDITNFLGRASVWIFLAVVISVYSQTPLQASLNVFIFFACMLISYYAYTKFIAGFFPAHYVILWAIIALFSPIPAYICWYAKGRGIIALIISSVIVGTLFIHAFSWGRWYFDLRYLTEVIVWLGGIGVLYKSPKQLAFMFALSLPIAFIIQLILPVVM